MLLFPAIDIKDGQCVRLLQGDFDQQTVYGKSPLKMAQKFEASGAGMLHVVDLDGARDGLPVNQKAIAQILKETGLKVQVGGGIRTMENIKNWIDLGVSRVILGTAAIENPGLLKEALGRYQEKIAVGVDVKDGYVATHGWEQSSRTSALEFCQYLERLGVETIIYTDIAKDGMLLGPNFLAYEELKEKTKLKIIASGGVSSLKDLLDLEALGSYGAITGKALYENRFTLEEAFLCLQNASFPA